MTQSRLWVYKGWLVSAKSKKQARKQIKRSVQAYNRACQEEYDASLKRRGLERVS